MKIKELQLLSEALWESVKTDLKFFSSIQLFVKKLSEFDYSELNKDTVNELFLYSTKIEEFFKGYRSTRHSSGLYIPPAITSQNDETVKRIFSLANELINLPSEDLLKIAGEAKPKTRQTSQGSGVIFVGHGRSRLWARVQLYLQDELKLKTISFESEPHTGESITNILTEFLNKASYAILILTAEDETSEGQLRARQNVIHEAGLFQGRLGFDKVIMLKQNNTEEFTNVAGLQYIAFGGDNIEQTFYELQRTLKKAGLLK
jgi:predicted nucleotide-binding protein